MYLIDGKNDFIKSYQGWKKVVCLIKTLTHTIFCLKLDFIDDKH